MNQHRHSINISQTSDDSQVISYLDIGSGPVLLFGHDYLFDNQMWTKQLLDLSQHYRCIVPDLWGHGQSQSLPKACLSLKALAEYHLALMDTLAIEKFSIIGSGIASMWGTELCLLAPTRVHTLTLLSCFLGFEPELLNFSLLFFTFYCSFQNPFFLIPFFSFFNHFPFFHNLPNYVFPPPPLSYFLGYVFFFLSSSLIPFFILLLFL